MNAWIQPLNTMVPAGTGQFNLKPFKMFEAEDYFVMRSPLAPVSHWHALLERGDPSSEIPEALRGLQRQWRDPAVREAIYLASASLHARVENWTWRLENSKDLKLALALYNYLARLATRATPFGLFASVSTGWVAERTALNPAGAGSNLRRRTQLDSGALASICERLLTEPAIRHRVSLRVNETGHRVGPRWHYVDWALNDGGRCYSLSSVELDDYLECALRACETPRTAPELAGALCVHDAELDHEEALEFVDCLIENHLLIPALEPCLTGTERLPALIADLDTIAPDHPARTALIGISRQLEALDAAGTGNGPAAYETLRASVRSLGIDRPVNRLLQVDVHRDDQVLSLDSGIACEIAAAAELSMRMGARRDRRLDEFCQRFNQRFEGCRVPLLQALDDEIGVGLRSTPGDSSSLLDGVAWQPREAARIDPGVRELLARRWSDARTPSGGELQLSPDEIPPWDSEIHGHAACSSHAVATLLADSHDALARREYRIHLRGVLGPSAANMLGRFGQADPALRDALCRSLAREADTDDGAIFAEIVHLPRERLGNLVCRPLFRAHEIQLLGRGGGAPQHRIALSDLDVEVRGRTVLLWSRRLGKRVVPRMSNAHNYDGDTLGLYRFLCLVQFQGHANGCFHAGLFPPGLGYIPRVRCGRVILSPATWHLNATDLKKLRNADAGSRFAAAQELRERFHLPRHAGLRHGDHLLPIDFEHELALESLCRAARKTPERLELIEIPGLVDAACAGEGHHAFAHELVVPLRATAQGVDSGHQRERELHQRFHLQIPPTPDPAANEMRQRLPGSDWLYLRIHGGPNMLDRLLGHTFLPLAERQRAGGLCAQWFYIRYNDPDWHLRLRLHGEPEALMSRVLPEWHELLARMQHEGRVARVELGTYARELERYGGPLGMPLSERWFAQESRRIASLLAAIRGGAPAWRWQLAGACLMRDLGDLGLDITTRTDLMTCLANGYRAEFSMQKRRLATLGAKYRQHTNAVLRACAGEMPADHPHPDDLLAIIERDRAERLDIARSLHALEKRPGRVHGTIETLAPSLVHMACNRWFTETPRANEMVLYDLLRRGLTALNRGAPVPKKD